MIALWATAWGAPAVDADPYVPTLDAGPFAVVDTSAAVETVVAAQSSWVTVPMRSVDATGAIQPVIRHAWAVHLGARQAIGPVRIGVAAPVIPVRIGPRGTPVTAVLGDPTVEAVAAWHRSSFTVGGLARAGVSLGAADRQLGLPGPFGEFGVIAAWRGPVRLAANVVYRITPTQELVETEVDDAFGFMAGVAVPLGLWFDAHRWSVALEATGHLPRRGLTADATPVELLVTTRAVLSDPVSINVGVGRGLTSGVGAPGLRIVAGLRFAVAGDVDRIDP